MTAAPFLSFVIPAYNEAPNLRPLCERILKTCAASGIDRFEVILVENGSADGSEATIRQLHAEDARIVMLQLSRNFGYQGAISAGLDRARGEWVAILDGDQQDPPELVPRFLDKAREGYDVVYGVRATRQEGFAKKLAYKTFYRVWGATAQITVPSDAGDFCIMHRNVVACITGMPERQRFVRGLRAWSGFRQTGVAYARDARAEGESKFNLSGMVLLALEGLLSYSVAPLRLMLVAGSLVALGSFVIGAVQGMFRLLNWFGMSPLPGILPPGLTQLNLLLTFFLGFNILCIGVLGEYVGRIYEEVKRRPIYVVKAALGGPVQPPSTRTD